MWLPVFQQGQVAFQQFQPGVCGELAGYLISDYSGQLFFLGFAAQADGGIHGGQPAPGHLIHRNTQQLTQPGQMLERRGSLAAFPGADILEGQTEVVGDLFLCQAPGQTRGFYIKPDGIISIFHWRGLKF